MVFLQVAYWVIERFHSRDRQPYWIIETKERICIKIEFNSRRISLYTIMAAIPLFCNTNMATVTSCENALFARRTLTTSCCLFVEADIYLPLQYFSKKLPVS